MSKYTLGGDPPQSRSEQILMRQDSGPSQSRLEELLKNGIGGGVTPEQIAAAVAAYLDEHGVSITIDSALSGTSENPVQNKVIKNALDTKGTYSKPSGGIPKTDLAADVQTSLGKADTALQQHQSLSGYATESYVQTQIDAIPDELPVVSASDNGKVLGVVNGAWSVKSDEGGGSAPFEIPITESGGTYSTTATAEEILAHADNCVLKQGGSALYQTVYGVQGSNAQIVFSSTDSINGFIQNVTFTVTVNNGTVAIGYYRAEDDLPTVSASDNGKFLRVVNGVWAAQAVPFQTPRVAMASTDTTPTLDPNKLYVFPEMASLAPTLATPTDNTVVNEYHFIFTSGATATTLTLPASVLQPDGFTVEANHVCEVSIVENCMTAQAWAVTA